MTAIALISAVTAIVCFAIAFCVGYGFGWAGAMKEWRDTMEKERREGG